MSFVKSIPTVGPHGLQFRSRIEAKWAYVFEYLNWDWEYEPIDLDGYIPDFIIALPNNENLLVEVKGDMDIWSSFEKYTQKIVNSGWEGRYIIVGSKIKKKEGFVGASIGMGGHTKDQSYETVMVGLFENKWILRGNEGDIDFWGITNDNFVEEDTSYDKFYQIWVDSHNKTQWNGINLKTPIHSMKFDEKMRCAFLYKDKKVIKRCFSTETCIVDDSYGTFYCRNHFHKFANDKIGYGSTPGYDAQSKLKKDLRLIMEYSDNKKCKGYSAYLVVKPENIYFKGENRCSFCEVSSTQKSNISCQIEWSACTPKQEREDSIFVDLTCCKLCSDYWAYNSPFVHISFYAPGGMVYLKDKK